MKTLNIVSYGGGVNSTAMLVYMVKAQIMPDAILFADTGGEREETYDYIKYFSEWLESKEFPKIRTVKYRTKHGVELTLEQDILNRKTFPSISFGFKTCSQRWKILPQEKFIKQWIKEFGTVDVVNHYIGFDKGEERRVKDNPIDGHVNLYPLLSAGWDRSECVRQIESQGLTVPGKSACIFCRNTKLSELRALKQSEKTRIINIETNAVGNVRIAGLGGRVNFTKALAGDTVIIDKEEKYADQFKKITGEELNPQICNCIG